MGVHTHIGGQSLPRLLRDMLSASRRVPGVVSVLSCALEELEVKKKQIPEKILIGWRSRLNQVRMELVEKVMPPTSERRLTHLLRDPSSRESFSPAP